ncbi:MAG: chromosome segregation protein SMC, partial [Oscillospiraceae bacterium]|nr:chromosome segregation protein SMC [Oscillospiraceae bacterium]
ILSVKSGDRREVFEEAAGISRYRHRKEDAERKLARTDENLVRINDKIDELELQVGPLREQAETAKKYLILRDEQRSLEISVWMATLDKLHSQSEQVAADYESAKANLDDAQRQLQALYDASENFQERMHECDINAETERARLSASEAAAAELDSSIAVLKTSHAHNEETIERVRSEISEQSDRAKNIENQIADADSRIAQIESEKQTVQADVLAVMHENEENAKTSGENQRELSELISQENSRNEALTQVLTSLAMFEGQGRESEQRRLNIDSEIEASEAKYNETSKALHDAEKVLEESKARLDEVNNVINGHRMLMGGRETKVKELTDKLNKITVDKRSAEGRINMLREMEKDFEGLGKAVKTVMREVSRGTLRGIHGPVASLITVSDEYAVAIETALGAAMQNIVVDTQNDGKMAIEMLKRSDGGRATFLPIETVKPGFLKSVPKGEDGYLGIASELVKFDKKYESVFSSLLGRTVVVETLGDAVRISKKYENQLRIVSLDGQLINAGGSMTGGSTAKNVGILSRANELKQLEQKLSEYVRREEECTQVLADAQRVLEKAKFELSVAENELSGVSDEYYKAENVVSQYRLLRNSIDENIENLETEKRGLAARLRENALRIDENKKRSDSLPAELEEIRGKISALSSGREEFEKRRAELSDRLFALREKTATLDAERDATERSKESLRELLAAISGDEQQRLRNIDDIIARNAAISAEIDEKNAKAQALSDAIAASKQKIDAIIAHRLEIEAKRVQNDKAGQDKNRELLELQSVCAHYEQKKLSAEMEEKQIVDKLWDSYELSRSAAQQLRQPIENMANATKRVSELKRDISRLGNVNVGAIEEFDRVSERYNFLAEQRDDVEKAKRDLEKIIGDITAEMKEIFITQFNAINESFRKVFLELFGGGKASLELEDEENVLECGIDIKVQPPGKAVTTISLLSGGEKAFVAIALYFAIMKIRPTPFCIMDEVEAALDEANVIKTAEYMRRMTKNTQFVVITHRRGTMEEADILYGVTMQEKGVTTVLSVDLEEAEKTIA